MNHLKSFGIKNFRVFDTEKGINIDLAPITLITGANNSGKSSILKALLMLSDSVKSSRNAFFNLDFTGKEHFLGNIENVLHKKECNEITITVPFSFMYVKGLKLTVTFSATDLKKKPNEAVIQKIKITDDDQPVMEFSYRKNMTEEERKTFARKEEEDLTPEDIIHGYIDWQIDFDLIKKYLQDLVDGYKKYIDIYYIVEKENKDKMFASALNEQASYNKFKEIENIKFDKYEYEAFFKKNRKNILLHDLQQSLGSQEKTNPDVGADIQQVLENFVNPQNSPYVITDIDNIHNYSYEDSVQEVIFSRIIDTIIGENILWKTKNNNVISSFFNDAWREVFNRIKTVTHTPSVRGMNARIYNLDTNNLFTRLIQDYKKFSVDTAFSNKWLKEFEIGNELDVKHIVKYNIGTVTIKTNSGSKELVDFGYGIMQFITILMQIVVQAAKNEDEGGYHYSILIIEEPETNLHPKWQSKLAAMFAEANYKFNIQFLIETHSEYMIRNFQNLVAAQKLKTDDVLIHYLRKKVEGKEQISPINIDENGEIKYYLFDSGFFDEQDNLKLSLLNIKRDNFITDFAKLKEQLQEQKATAEEREQQLQAQLDEYTKKLDLSTYETVINGCFDTLKLLEPNNTKNYLSSGQYLLANIPDSSDFSPVIIQYGRAIENELKQIFIALGTIIIPDPKKLLFGSMQGSLYGVIGIQKTPTVQNVSTTNLLLEMSNRFDNPTSLKIQLIEEIRTTRNDAGHAGVTKTKIQAQAYIVTVNEFLYDWIVHRK